MSMAEHSTVVIPPGRSNTGLPARGPEQPHAPRKNPHQFVNDCRNLKRENVGVLFRCRSVGHAWRSRQHILIDVGRELFKVLIEHRNQFCSQRVISIRV